MNELNALLRNVTAAVLWPFAGWPPLVPLVVLSALAGIVMAVVFRFTSPQRKLRRVADLCRAETLAIKLFKDDPAAMFLALGRLLRHSGKRLWYSLPPMLVMLVPFVLLLTHLAVWYEYRPLGVGEQAVVELQLAVDAWPQNRDASLQAPPEIAVQTDPLRDRDEQAVFWRIRAESPTRDDLHWQLASGPTAADAQVAKRVTVAQPPESFLPISVRRAGPGWWDRLLYPGEDALDAGSPARGIAIDYPHRSTPVFGWDVPWWVTLLVVSIVSALLVRPLVGVQF